MADDVQTEQSTSTFFILGEKGMSIFARTDGGPCSPSAHTCHSEGDRGAPQFLFVLERSYFCYPPCPPKYVIVRGCPQILFWIGILIFL